MARCKQIEHTRNTRAHANHQGPNDHQTVEAAIASGEPVAFKLIWKAFPGNQSRAESMAKRLAASNNPVTRYGGHALDSAPKDSSVVYPRFFFSQTKLTLWYACLRQDASDGVAEATRRAPWGRPIVHVRATDQRPGYVLEGRGGGSVRGWCWGGMRWGGVGVGWGVGGVGVGSQIERRTERTGICPCSFLMNHESSPFRL